MARSKRPPAPGTPRTGDGWTSSAKPRREDLQMRTKDNRPTYQQPRGWTGKVIQLFKKGT